MKLTKYFMPFAALALLASCSNDNLDAPGNENPSNSSKGNMYMSVNLSEVTTRTTGESNMTEAGTDEENKITDAILIFTRDVSSTETIFKVYYLAGTQVNTMDDSKETYAVFEVSREDFTKDITDNGSGTLKYNLYAVANPTTAMANKFEALTGTEWTDVFEDSSDAGTFWQDNRFLMSNVEKYQTIEISTSDIAEGTHTTTGSALNLSPTQTPLKVQRAMGRFDLIQYKNSDEVTASWKYPKGSGDSKVTILFDQVALFNQATKAEVFKVTAAPASFTYSEGKSLSLDAEDFSTKHVWTPTQTAFTHPLFNTTLANGTYPNATGEGVYSYEPFNENDNLDWFELDDLSRADNEVNGLTGDYYFWRYVMENTNYGADLKQAVFKGNTTGVVFRAQLKFGENESATLTGADNQADLYAFGNMIIGDGKQLYKYVSGEDPSDDVWDLAKSRFNAALDAYNADEENEDDQLELSESTTNQDIAKLNKYLVANDYSIYDYDTTDNGYFCYYVYYNRHDDNGKNTIMGNMEFAVVRNNVYKLKISAVNALGHPADPENDPDPEKPGDNPETDHLYFAVDVEVVPWIVRVNDIIF